MKSWIFALALTAVFLPCEATAADPPPINDESAAIVERLDQILNRLDEIEQRLTQLELESQLTQAWWLDERGVMRSGSGRPIGFWGIDGPVTNLRR